MKLSLTGLSLFLVFTCACIGQPRISINETNFDFGFAPEGAYMMHTYIIRNSGNDTLRIKRVRTTCGCTSAPLSKMAIAPGDSGDITIIFNSTRYFHKTSKAAIIATDDPERPSEKITFVAELDSTKFTTLKPTPKILDLGNRKSGEVTIKNITNQPLVLMVVDHYWYKISQPQPATADLPPNGSVKLTVSINDKVLPGENFTASFTVAALNTEGQEVCRFTIPVKGVNQ